MGDFFMSNVKEHFYEFLIKDTDCTESQLANLAKDILILSSHVMEKLLLTHSLFLTTSADSSHPPVTLLLANVADVADNYH